MTKYRMEMTEEQAHLVIRALDFFSRMRMGQWGELARLTPPPSNGNIADYQAARDTVEDLLLQARDIVMPELKIMHSLHGSYSVFSFNDALAAWNVLRAIRSCIAWHNHPEGGVTVDFDRPSGDAPTVGAVDDGKMGNC